MTTPALRGLTELAHDQAVGEGLRAQLDVANKRLASLEERCAGTVASLASELEDVARLESMSMTRILASLRGRRDLDLDREQAEVEAARYAAAEAEARRAAAQREVDAVVTRLAELGDLDARRTALLRQREAEVAADPEATATAARLAELATAAGARQAEAEQLDQALAAAAHARTALAQAAQHLGGAADWATFDTFLGGGMFTDMVKYDRLDKAAALMREADAALGHLASELADVGMQHVGGIGISEMTSFFDVWFDNIFSDWAVRDRVNRAAHRVADVHAAVEVTVGELQRRMAACEAETAGLAREREALLGP